MPLTIEEIKSAFFFYIFVVHFSSFLIIIILLYHEKIQKTKVTLNDATDDVSNCLKTNVMF